MKAKQQNTATLHLDGEKFMSQMVFNSDTAPTIEEWMDPDSDYWQQQKEHKDE